MCKIRSMTDASLTLASLSLSLSPSLGKRINNRWMYEMYLMLRTVRAQLPQLRGAAAVGRVSFRLVFFFVFTTFELTSGIGGRIGDLLEGIQIGGNCLNGSAVNIEKQTEIDDYNRETGERERENQQKLPLIMVLYGGNSPTGLSTTKISNKLCKKLYWPWATFQLKMAEAQAEQTNGQAERERQRSRQTDREQRHDHDCTQV